ncbi:hypothetical protein [Acetobacter thailandicus]|uniref:hypothetical protein n=1 Tax=Acetobacter thailandicus TaxID=1502842 RepID=UPI001BA5439F|nr:hypothetical protein [Acetobacter thailandicus]MBS0985689.1 hypothetical protein [Acetobacter thailandicus]
MSDLVVHCANSDLNSIATALQTAKIHLIDDTRHGWPWKEIFQGVVTLCVGLFAGWIAWQQKEIAKENKEITKQKLKLEIFEKRMEIISNIENFYKTQNDLRLFELEKEIIIQINRSSVEFEYDGDIKYKELIKKLADKYIKIPSNYKNNSINIKNIIKCLFTENTSILINEINDKLNESYKIRLDYMKDIDIIEDKFTIKDKLKTLQSDFNQVYDDMWESLRENEFKGLSDW